MNWRVLRRATVVGIVTLSLCVGLYIGACVLGGSSVGDAVLFLGRFIQEPRAVGAVAPSSRQLAEALVERLVPGGSGEPKYFLEVGPGTGVVTEELVRRLGPDDLLDVVELDKKMATELQKKYSGNKHVVVHHCSITDWKPRYRYDGVVVGIPFNALSFGLVESIWGHIATLVKKGAVTSYFSYLWLARIKKALLAREEKQDFKKIQRYLESQNKQYGIGSREVLPNMPPAKVWHLVFNS